MKGKNYIQGIVQRMILITMFAFGMSSAFAQQDPMYSQYMFNGLVVNPAYAGSRDALSAMLLVRKQWVGINGAPLTQNFSIHTPTRNRKSGFGLMVVNDKISYLGQTWINMSYAYRIHLNRKAKLAFGLQGSLYNYRINWDQAVLINPGDPILNTYARNYWMPNAGFGVYYSSEHAYLGASAPRLLENTFEGGRPGVKVFSKDSSVAALKRHFFVTGGYMIRISPDFKIKPSVLFKYVSSAPFEIDGNLNFYFYNRFGVGVSYRSNDGIVGMVDFLVNRQLRIGYAYDYPFQTELRGFTSGSHELMIGYDFFFENDEVVSPRFF